jgi:hypothetical protein
MAPPPKPPNRKTKTQPLRLRLPLLLLLLLLFPLQSCSSPTPRQLYWSLEADSKRVFLAYYPLLNPEQREALLNGSATEVAARSWSFENSPVGKKSAEMPKLTEDPSHYTLKDIHISGNPELEVDEITQGKSINLRAELRYQDGRKADATDDVVWTIEPATLGHIDGKTLRFACVSSDLIVGADFYHERQGARTFRIRKKVAALEIAVDGASLGFDRSQYVGLKLVARCADGTESEVSCQAQWRSLSPQAVDVSGCGNLTIVSQELVNLDPVTVSATYGGVTTTRAIPLSQFKR